MINKCKEYHYLQKYFVALMVVLACWMKNVMEGKKVAKTFI